MKHSGHLRTSTVETPDDAERITEVVATPREVGAIDDSDPWELLR